MTYRYFAYGSSLSAGHFAEWAGEHGYAGRSLDDGEVSMLSDYELVLTVPSRYWGGGVGTLLPRRGGTVNGVLFSLADEDADMIRHKEGVVTGLYREVTVEVEVGRSGVATTMKLVRAHAFVAADDRTVDTPLPPSRRWLEHVLRGARAHGLPTTWLDVLSRKLQGAAM